MSKTSVRISFKNHNIGGNSADGFRVYRKEGSDPCPDLDPEGLPLPDLSNLIHESMHVLSGENLWVDSSIPSASSVGYYYRISFFRNNGINPGYGSVSHERVDSMLLGPFSAASGDALGYPNNFPSNLSGVAYALDVQPVLHLDPSRTVRENTINHEEALTTGTTIDYSGRGWVNMLPAGGADSVFDLENILDANGSPVPCYRFDNPSSGAFHNIYGGIGAESAGTAPWHGSFGTSEYTFCDEGYTVFVLLSPVPKGLGGFITSDVSTNMTWIPYHGANGAAFAGEAAEVFEWSSQEVISGGGVGSGIQPNFASVPAGSITQFYQWGNSFSPAYASMRNTNATSLSTWRSATRALLGTSIMGTPPSFPEDPTNPQHWLSHLHLTTLRVSPIITETPKYQGWINGGAVNGSSLVHPHETAPSDFAPLAPGLAQATPKAYFLDMTPPAGNHTKLFGAGAYVEYLLFPKALSNAQMTTVGAYLNNKYALPSPIEPFTGAHG
ncbi:MAG: hypothetical protein CME70_18410 [Halobacteriovorax sp.]|nr:hypothetical protein [Halobacteriovorax sp.]